MPNARPLILAIDSTSDLAGVALLEDGALLGEVSWQARQSHSRQLLPATDWLLGHVERAKSQIGGIAVCLGPGSYAGMRVGLSSAKALAYGLDVPLAGVGRLAAEALPVAEAGGARVVPLQAAGRAELAWAAYRFDDGALEELAAPGLVAATALPKQLRRGDVVTGDVGRLGEALTEAIRSKGCRIVAPSASRVVAVARLGRLRLEAGDTDNVDALEPMYLREPAIGPQPPR